jgi:hypothetical protein
MSYIWSSRVTSSKALVYFRHGICLQTGLIKTTFNVYSFRETVAPIRHLVACGSDSWVRGLVLRLTVRLNLARGCAALTHRADLPHCA